MVMEIFNESDIILFTNSDFCVNCFCGSEPLHSMLRKRANLEQNMNFEFMPCERAIFKV